MPVHPRKLHNNSYINIIHNQIDNYYSVCPAAIDEEIVSEDESVIAKTMSAVELKKLELREREKEREDQLCLKELEFKEHELAMQLKIRELELTAATPTPISRHTEFDVSKQIRFVPHSSSARNKDWKLVGHFF